MQADNDNLPEDVTGLGDWEMLHEIADRVARECVRANTHLAHGQVDIPGGPAHAAAHKRGDCGGGNHDCTCDGAGRDNVVSTALFRVGR